MSRCPKISKKVPITRETCLNCKLNCKFDFLRELEDDEIEFGEDKETLYNYAKAWKRGRLIKRIVLIALICLLALGLGIIGITIGVNVSAKNQKNYDALNKKMQVVTEYDFEYIDLLINKLPKNYKNIKDIKNEYQIVKTNLNKLQSHINYSDAYSIDARLYYIELAKFDEEHDNWNLSNLLLQANVIDKVIYGAEFVNTDSLASYYFKWSDSDIGSTLQTNLPNAKDKDKSYYYGLVTRSAKLCFEFINTIRYKFIFCIIHIDKLKT